jgi:hypothetical protein
MGRLRLAKYVVWLLMFGMLGLTAFALLSELPAPTREVSVPLKLPEEGS